MKKKDAVNNSGHATDRLLKILPVLLLVAATVMVVIAAAGNRLPFIDTLVPGTDESNTTSYTESDNGWTDTSIPGSDTDDDENAIIRGALARFDDDYTDGFVLSDLCYNDEMRLVLTAHFEQLPEGAVSFTPRMGFIFVIDNEGNTSLYDEYGKLLLESLPEDCEFAGVRDAEDRPLFLIDGEYYFLDRQTLTFSESSYEYARNTRGVEFDYPSYYGRYQDGLLVRKKSSGGWGIYDTEDGSYVVYPDKEVIFMFNGADLACALEYGSDRLRFYNHNGNSITREYYQPLTNGIESLGYYHFTNGLTRVRRVYTQNGEQMSEECLMYTDKSLFKLPADFTLLTYSDGIIQLEKDGRSGYMSWTGKWITDPLYTSSQPFLEGLAVVGRDGKYGVIDTEGNYVVPMVFDSITNCSGGILVLHDEATGWYVVNKTSLPDGGVNVDIN